MMPADPQVWADYGPAMLVIFALLCIFVMILKGVYKFIQQILNDHKEETKAWSKQFAEESEKNRDVHLTISEANGKNTQLMTTAVSQLRSVIEQRNSRGAEYDYQQPDRRKNEI